jgi:hypothetical protein
VMGRAGGGWAGAYRAADLLLPSIHAKRRSISDSINRVFIR